MPKLVSLLTPRQEKFAQEYAKTRNASQAYRASYDASGLNDLDISKRAREVLHGNKVRERVQEILEEAAAPTVFTVGEVLSRLVAIAMADPNELVSLKIGACRHCHGEGHQYQWREHEYLEALDAAEKSTHGKVPNCAGGFGYDATREPATGCPVCHGEGEPRLVLKDTENLSPAGQLLYGGVKQTKNGIEVIMADRMKALELAGRVIGAFNDKVQISGKLEQIAQTVTTTYADANEAAQAYQRMVAGALAPDTRH